jgi:hypothetical protein
MTYVRYLSGPMRTVKDFNYPTFLAVEAALAEELSSTGHTGWEILNPARNFDGDNTRETNEYMQLDMEMVLASDEIVLLPGWRNSEGARREVELAKWVGKSFTEAFQIDDVWYFRSMNVPTLDDSPRASALAEATQLITGDRNSQYGPPTADFKRTADMATGFGFGVTADGGKTYRALKGHHVAIFMMLLKTSRLAWTPAKRDSWVDDAGYAGCGYECAVEEANASLPEASRN